MFSPTTNERTPARWFRPTCIPAVALICILLVATSANSPAQLPKSAPPAAPPPPVVDPLQRETPRSMFEGVLRCGAVEDFACMARYLQPPSGQDIDLVEVSRELRALRSRYEGDIAFLSTDPYGRVEKGLPPGMERAGVIKVGGTSTDILLVRVDDPEYGKIWLVSSETVAKIPQLYAQSQSEGPTLVERVVPATLLHHHMLGMSLAQWVGWLLSIPVSLLLAWLLAFIVSLPVRVWHKLRGQPIKTLWEGELSPPILCIIAIGIHGVLAYLLEPPLLYRSYYFRFLAALLVGCIAWLLSRLADRGFDRAVNRRRTSGRGGQSILLLMQRANRILLLIIAFVFGLALLGVNVETTLAGLGIGGLAIALGAQKTLENILGGLSLLMDKAVHEGDFCEIGGKLGTVEDIGLRSLRLRTLDQNMLVVPNAALAQMQFQNMKTRSKLLISQNFCLRIETRVNQLRFVLDGVQRMLNEHPAIEAGTSRIRVADFAGSAFEMELWAYAKTNDWMQFTVIRQDVILRIAEIVEAAGTRLAAPTRLMYVSGEAATASQTSIPDVER